MAEHFDVIIIGAGAAGLMCAATAGYRGRRVLVIERSKQPGRKILMSGGGRCNFTHLHSTPEHFLSDNPFFCISALRRYPPENFVELVERHGIDYVEKAPGQLFCRNRSHEILDLLLAECNQANAEIRTRTDVTEITRRRDSHILRTSRGELSCESLVVACGGLSIPTMGASSFGYDIARQFGLRVLPTRAGLVPFTLQPDLLSALSPLAGISCPVEVHCNGQSFHEPMLVTHRGLSGPAMLQISSYWRPGDPLFVDLLPGTSICEELFELRRNCPDSTLANYLERRLPRRFAGAFSTLQGWGRPVQEFSNRHLEKAAYSIGDWKFSPCGTEGYRTAEVTLGGVDTRELSSRTMAARDWPGLFFIGEVVDVTGHLGGHNFQWAWASGVAAGQHA